MPWYGYLLDCLAGALLANGVPHFVEGTSGRPFPSPFARPPGIGNSSPLTNALWGFANLVAGALLLRLFWPNSDAATVGPVAAGWLAAALGALAIAVQLSVHFGKVRAKKLE